MPNVSSRSHIIIRGARENNLRDINLTLPKNAFIVFTGVSGSGKSTLAFNTIYEEGRRRYIDSLSSYARQFLGNTRKPDVDSIDGLTPAVSIEQKTTHNSPRSTVGTITEIYDYLRLLYARIGRGVCPTHSVEIQASKLFDIINTIYQHPVDTMLIIIAPLGKMGARDLIHRLMLLKESGYYRVRVDNQQRILEDEYKVGRGNHTLDVIIDRIVVRESARSRIFEALESAFNLADGLVVLEYLLQDEVERRQYTRDPTCIECQFRLPPLETNLFSFNSPQGMCTECKGIGYHLRAHIDLLIPDRSLSINRGALRCFASTYNTANLEWQEFDALLTYFQINKDVPVYELHPSALEAMMRGTEEEVSYSTISESGRRRTYHRRIEGLAHRLESKYAQTKSDELRRWLRSFLTELPCDTCSGARLNKYALAVQVDGINIYQMSRLSINSLASRLADIQLSEYEQEVSRLILQELRHRLSFLIDVGLEYLTLNRYSETLSGGESQRIRLATQIGSRLTGILYVLDEPSIGLHQRDNKRLISALRQMVDIGNTLIVVEHDSDTILASDYVVDIGPQAGIAGGQLIYAGPVDQLCNITDSLTSDYLYGRRVIMCPKSRRSGNGKAIDIEGARHNNLQNLHVTIPLNMLVAVTGVSGSGKSSLVNEVLVKGIINRQGDHSVIPGEFTSIKGHGNINRVIQITQSPIGRTPRSNPATYTGVFNDIRELYAQLPASRERGYTASRFSFNVPGGRCDKCEGDGVIRIAMQFLPDVYVKCDHCNGTRYHHETLQVHYRGMSISDVLEMRVAEAIEHFAARPKIVSRLQTLKDVGLDYIQLGQSATTLSGGEAQRVKLATHLQRRLQTNILYVLDEPTTGLHNYDVEKLILVLNRLVDSGNTVLVIEHNLDLIKCADHIIDLGPDGGQRGGRLIVSGTPEHVAQHETSYTAAYLRDILAARKD